MKIRFGGESFILHLTQLLPFLAVLFTVFVVRHDMANGVVSGKYCWFYCAMAAIAVVGTVSSFWEGRALRLRWIDVMVFAFCLWELAVTLLNGGAGSTKFILLVLLLLLYFYLRCYLSLGYGRRGDNYLLVFFLFTGLVEAVWGLEQLYDIRASQHGQFKFTGSFFNPGPYAGYLAMVAPMAFYYLLSGYRVLQRKFCRRYYPFYLCWGLSALTVLSILLVLPATMSRAAWLAALGGCGLVLGVRNYELGVTNKKGVCKKNYKLLGARVKAKRTALLLIVATGLAACAVGAYYLKKNSADGRLLIWKISLQTLARHPFGVGLGNFSGAYGETQVAYFASGQATETEQLVAGNPEYGFNEYLQIAVESGIIAFLLFAGIIVLAVRNMIKAKNWGVLGSLTALLVFAFFSYPFSVLPFLIVFAFLLAIGQGHTDDTDLTDLRRSSLSENHLKICANPSNLRHLCATMLALSCLLVTVGCLYKQYPVYQAYRQWKTEQVYYHAGLYRDAAESYESLYPYLNDQIRFLFEYAQCLSKSEQLEKSNAVLQCAMQISCDPMLYNIMGKNYQAMKQYEEAEMALVKSTRLVPSRLYPWYLLTKLYAEMGWEEKAAETAEIVLTKEPKVQSPAVREMREEVRKLKVKN